MSFFTRNSAQPRTKRPPKAPDNIILNIGQIADEAILDAFSQSRAFWAAYRRKEAETLETQYPGYREELNKSRAAVGLPPV